MTLSVGNSSGISSGGAGSGMPLSPANVYSAGTGGNWKNLLELGFIETYAWSTDTTATDPATGYIKGNNGTPGSITELYVSSTSQNGVGVGEMVKLFQAQDFMFLVNYEDSSSFTLVRCTGDAIDNGTWFTIPVQVESSGGGVFPNNGEISIDIVPMAGRNPSIEALVFVSSVDDLPSPVGGVIDLLDNKQYLQVADIDFGTTQVRYGKSRYSGLGTNVTTATYTGTGALFLCTGESTLDNLTIDTINGSPLDWNTTGGLIMRWENCTVPNCDRAATFTANGGAVRMTNITYRNIITNGHVLTGAFVSFNYQSAGIFITLGDIFDITAATFTVFFNLADLVVASFPAGTAFIRGLTNDANLPGVGVATVANCRLFGAGTPLVGVAVSDIRWDFISVTPIPNSSKAGDSYLTGTQVVPISVIDDWQPIAGVLWESDVLARCSSTSAGIVTYTGRDISNFLILAATTLEKVGGGSDMICTAIAINGVLTGGSFEKTISCTDNNSPTSLTSTNLVALSTGDTIQVFVKNMEGIANIRVSSCNLSMINGF